MAFQTSQRGVGILPACVDLRLRCPSGIVHANLYSLKEKSKDLLPQPTGVEERHTWIFNTLGKGRSQHLLAPM